MKKKRRSGFTLVELMTSVVILATLSAVAFPVVISARKAGNEATAVGSIRALASALEQHRNRYASYPPNLIQLEQRGLVEGYTLQGNRLEKSGYQFRYSRPTRETWTVQGAPLRPGRTGDRTYFIDTSAVIRHEADGSPADETSPVLK